jgi:hypothetical protein
VFSWHQRVEVLVHGTAGGADLGEAARDEHGAVLLQGEHEGIGEDLAQGVRVGLGDGLQAPEDEGREVLGLCGHGRGERVRSRHCGRHRVRYCGRHRGRRARFARDKRRRSKLGEDGQFEVGHGLQAYIKLEIFEGCAYPRANLQHTCLSTRSFKF